MKVITKKNIESSELYRETQPTIETTLANPHAPNQNLPRKEFPTLMDRGTPA